MKKLDNLKKDILSCKVCKDIFEHDPNPIFQGNEHSHIFQIGQAPSRTVMETGKPFNDASGKKLLNDWYQITREQFYDPDNFYRLLDAILVRQKEQAIILHQYHVQSVS